MRFAKFKNSIQKETEQRMDSLSHGKIFDESHSEEFVSSPFSKIKEAIWVESKAENAKEITCLKYGIKDVYVKVTLTESCKDKTMKIKYFEYDSIYPNSKLKEINYNINTDLLVVLCPVTFTIDDYIVVDEDDVCEYIFEIEMDGEEYAPKKKLEVHAVIYIPEIMDYLGWHEGAIIQRKWFNNKEADHPLKGEPNIGGLSIEWILGFQRVKKEFDKKMTTWNTDKAINQLRLEIKRMIADKVAEYPTLQKKTTTFGTFDSKLKSLKIKEDGKEITTEIPTYDNYYYQSFVYVEDKFGTLDDFYATVANCTFRFVAKGIMEYQGVGKIMVTIEEFAIYMRDGFDFVGTQWLGYWSLEKKDVQRNPFGTSYRLIDNASYRDYRKAAGMGGDFYNYSTLKRYKVNYTFTL